MPEFRKILCPVDLSTNSLDAVRLSSMLAAANNARLILVHVGLPPLPPEALYAQADMNAVIEREKAIFATLRPTDESVEFEHVFERGNAGPAIVRVARDRQCDLIVLSTHGRTGIARLLMGSVAEYIIRNAPCPVLSFRQPSPTKDKSAVSTSDVSPYITSIMRHIPPVYELDDISEVESELNTAFVSAAPVIDLSDQCVGILTSTDIEKYWELRQRYDEKDPAVLDEVFETNQFGQRRTNNASFHQVQRHMTSPVISVTVTSTCDDGRQIFLKHPEIHHLVVVDDKNKPLGIVESKQLMAMSRSFSVGATNEVDES
jgi:nucleotide-binding universal stress UspA family protein